MEIKDILNGITIALDGIYPNASIYTEKVPQGFTKPAILVQMISFEHIQQINKRWRVTPMFNIQYFPFEGTVECYDANLKIQQQLDTITLINNVKMLARAANSNVTPGENGEVVGHNFMRFDFFLKSAKELEPMLTFTQFVNNERVNIIG